MATSLSGLDIMRGLISRGYSPVQAAALAGHSLQESGGDPTNVNTDEGAHGLIQWRQDRWDNLQKFAKGRGTSPDDPNTQLDFIGQEMHGPEARNSTQFLSATDLPSASSALKRYIRFGDDSGDKRLNNAVGLLAQYDPNAPVQAAPPPATPGAAPLPVMPPGQVPVSTAPGAIAAPAQPGAANPYAALQQMAQTALKPTQFAPLQPIQMAQPQGQNGAAQAIAAAIARQYGQGQS